MQVKRSKNRMRTYYIHLDHIEAIQALSQKLQKPQSEIVRLIWPRPPSWWKFVSSVSMPEKFLPQLPYNERSQSDQGLGIPLKQPSTASLVLDLSIHRFVAGGSDH